MLGEEGNVELRRTIRRRVTAWACALLTALAMTGGGVRAGHVTAAGDTPRSCGWQFRFDPDTVNVAYPDQSANYWFAALPAAPGARLHITGIYPHARYISFTTYDPQLRAVDGLNDVSIAPDPGSADPFVTGASRTTANRVRHYSLDVVFGQRPATGAAPNTLYTTSADGSHSAPFFLVVYRLYEPDRGRDITGGAGMPSITYSAPGSPSRTLPQCPYPDAPPTGANETIANAGSPLVPHTVSPGDDPPRWHKFYNLPTSVVQNTTDQIYALASPYTLKLPAGGYVENPDNKYVYAALSHRFGRMVVIHARMPTTPRTLDGEPVMQPGQLRYWSMCSNDAPTQRFFGCARDDQVPVSAAGSYTIVVSTAAERPANARPECGIAWLPWGPGDGSLLIMRNMLPSPTFTQSIQSTRLGFEPVDMGAYYPTAQYTTAQQVGALGCTGHSSSSSGPGANAA